MSSEESKSLLGSQPSTSQEYGSVSSEDSRASAITQENEMRPSLPLVHKIAFGIGHVYNDLAAAVWFSYTLLFMHSVMSLPGPAAGALVMWGQVMDAVATPIVGHLSDKYGSKRQWHISGSVFVFFSFPAIFAVCPMCNNTNLIWECIYFAIVILIFQSAWATVQIAHLAMIPEMSRSNKDRSDLTALRYSGAIVSNLIVYGVTWAVLQNRTSSSTAIGPADAFRFRDLSLIITLVGVSMTVLFHFSLAVANYEQRRLQAIPNQRQTAVTSPDETDRLITSSNPNEDDHNVTVITGRARKDFLRNPLLYQNALLYVFARLFMTTALIYIPLWIDERSAIPVANGEPSPDKSIDHIAIVPLVSFVASFVASLILKSLNRFISHQMAYFVGSLVGIAGCVLVILVSPSAALLILLVVAVLFGTGSSITMISSLCITADMVGENTDLGGFVYSAVTFADKLITGVAVLAIEAMKCDRQKDCPEYYKEVLSFACGGAACLGIVTLISLQITKICCHRFRRTEAT
ncbi:major facilitator superfamily domain-containing protein 12-like [Phlebotomus argentipes]|uniref:major facilitator superfamily domain-containing protein 12-like n=1 Tax=Phlebotomus argentipes TaxID=94469 RepID=UPI002892C84E|nr:major facilitator superfamily domain-containing protein 12-like [Phlebotomus argentipes]